jgi:hypothetical protein
MGLEMHAVVCAAVVCLIAVLAAPHVLDLRRMLSTTRVYVPCAYTRRRVHILTLETRAIRVLAAHDRSLRDYAARHGYKYTSIRAYTPPGPALPVYMQKLQLMLEALEGGFEFVVWMDSDTLVSHPDVPLEAVLEREPDAHIFIGREYPAWIGVWFGYVLNAGFFVLRCSDVSAAFLRECIELYMRNPVCKKGGKFVSAGLWAGECYEQGLMNMLLAGKYHHVVAELPSSVVASSYLTFPGAVIMHGFGKWKPHAAFERRLAELGVP